MTHEEWLQRAVEMAVESARGGDDPFAALVVRNGELIGAGTNQVQATHDPSAHAELLAIKEACAGLETLDLSDCVLYASGEPCPMCLGAAYWAQVGEIFFACSKQEALDAAGFGDPLEHFYRDRGLPADKQSISLIQNKVEDSLKPFLVWSDRQSK